MISFLMWIIVGALVGWVASLIMGTDWRQGALLNILIGIGGAALGGIVFRSVGLPGSNINEGLSFYSFIVSLIGAVVLIAITRLLESLINKRM